MPDDWRERWRSWLHPDSYAHPNSPAGGSGTGFSRTPGPTGYSWSPLPDPNSPAGRFIHFETELWALEQRERDEVARHLEQLETSLAGRSDKFRASIPDGYLRTLYDRQVGRTKGTYDFAKSLIATGVDAALLLQKLTSPVGWLDPDLQRKVQQGFSFGVGVSKVYLKWEVGTLQEKKQVLQQVGALAERVYQEAQNSIQQQWAEAKRTGKQEELIERWKTRLLLEAAALAIGAEEAKAVGAVAKVSEPAAEFTRTTEVAANRAASTSTGEIASARQYGKNTATWIQDSQGKTVRVEANIREVSSKLRRARSEVAAQKAAADAGRDGDVGGHIVGHRFMGDQGEINLFPPILNTISLKSGSSHRQRCEKMADSLRPK